jgi:TonB family protein
MTTTVVVAAMLLSAITPDWGLAASSQGQSPQMGSVRGKVVEAGSQNPLGGVAVTLVGTTMKTATDQKGEFAIPDVPEGTYTAIVSLSGYTKVRWENIHVVATRDVYVMFALSPAPAFPSGNDSTSSQGEGRPIGPEESDYAATVEQCPEPIGGLVALMKRVRYPEIALKGGIQGTVYVEAFINEEGLVDKVKVVKGVHELLDSAAVDAVKATRFSAGRQKGKPVKTRVAIPIRFRISS